ncbi:MAG: response regulator transcription factor [Chlorobi bacterium]|nr:response regulator transcription factor [Chlorobiota bacterium]
MKIRVAIAEDNDLLAASIEEKLCLFTDDINFRYRASNGKDLLRKLEEDHVVDTILMDIEMPELDGIKATEAVAQSFPNIKVIMLTVFDDEDKIFRAIQAGANGYLLKDETPDKILDGIKMIMNGGAPMSPGIASKALDILRNPERATETPGKDFSLSKRENEVLLQLSRGLDYNKISDNLFISPSTVRKHIENIYKKLQVNNKVQAIRKAYKHKLL